MWRLTNNLGAVTVRGRWSNQRTARLYIDQAQQELAALQLTTAQLHALQQGIAFFTAWKRKQAR